MAPHVIGASVEVFKCTHNTRTPVCAGTAEPIKESNHGMKDDFMTEDVILSQKDLYY